MVRLEVVLAAFIVAAVVGSLAVITVNPVPASTATSSTTTTTASTSVSTTSTTTSTVSSTSSSSTGQISGIANGTISIGPLQPVCLVNSTKGPPPSDIASIEAVITSSSGGILHVPLNWSVYAKCEADGQFRVALQPGSYSLDLSSCTYMGCKNSLPKEFTVYPNLVTTVDVSIDTGIR